MSKYIFLVDIDGTLLYSNTSIPDKVVDSAFAFTKAGGLLGLCTGRSVVSTIDIAEMLPVNIPSVLYNGSGIYDFSKKEFLKTRFLDDGIIDAIRHAYNDYPGVSISVHTTEGIFLIRTNERFNVKSIRKELQDKISSIDDIKGSVLKIVFASDDVETLEKCGKECFSDFKFAFASKHFAEVVSPESGKGAGLLDISEICGIPTERIFFAGDAMTDLPAVQLAGFSFAPSNSAKAILDICSMTVPSCIDGGMELAFKKAISLMV